MNEGPSREGTTDLFARRASCCVGGCMEGPADGVEWFLMSIDPRLLEILVCPQDKGELEYLEAEQVLVNYRLGIAYPIVDDIPVMLADEAIAWPNK